jgi:hypothetical protein
VLLDDFYARCAAAAGATARPLRLVDVGLGRIVGLYCCSSTLYRNR